MSLSPLSHLKWWNLQRKHSHLTKYTAHFPIWLYTLSCLSMCIKVSSKVIRGRMFSNRATHRRTSESSSLYVKVFSNSRLSNVIKRNDSQMWWILFTIHSRHSPIWMSLLLLLPLFFLFRPSSPHDFSSADIIVPLDQMCSVVLKNVTFLLRKQAREHVKRGECSLHSEHSLSLTCSASSCSKAAPLRRFGWKVTFRIAHTRCISCEIVLVNWGDFSYAPQFHPFSKYRWLQW